jgi:hypothetical protein
MYVYTSAFGVPSESPSSNATLECYAGRQPGPAPPCLATPHGQRAGGRGDGTPSPAAGRGGCLLHGPSWVRARPWRSAPLGTRLRRHPRLQRLPLESVEAPHLPVRHLPLGHPAVEGADLHAEEVGGLLREILGSGGFVFSGADPRGQRGERWGPRGGAVRLPGALQEMRQARPGHDARPGLWLSLAGWPWSAPAPASRSPPAPSATGRGERRGHLPGARPPAQGFGSGPDEQR